MPTVLITGATSGLGLALAQIYAARHARLVLVGRRPLAELDPSFFTTENYCQLDLADRSCADELLSWLDLHDVGTIDLLIQNAGAGYVGAISAQTRENIRELVAVNLIAPILLTHALYPNVAAAAGQIVYISSVAASLPAPGYAVYAATKAALDGFVRNLQIEVAASQDGVRIQLIRPGAARTGMHAKSGATLAMMNWEKFPPADAVAAQIVDAIERGEKTATIGAASRLIQLANRVVPRAVDARARANYARSTVREESARTDPSVSTEAAATRGHCVITGAADGIGRALVLEFAHAGYMITGIDIDAEQAMRTQAEVLNRGGSARFVVGDLSNHVALQNILAVVSTRPPIDVLVHSAGINAVGRFVDSDIERQLAVIDINFTAPLLSTADLLGAARIRHGAALVFISSLSHFVGYPGAAVYAATKDGLSSFARSLDIALAAEDVHTLTVYPGPTRTAHARRYSPDNRRENRRMPPEKVARAIFDAVQKRQRRLIPGLTNRAFARFGLLLPRLAESAMRRAILEKLD